MVVQYVAFLAAFRHPGAMSPYAAGVLGSLLTTWVTFAPCFLWIFLGAPYVEALRGNRTIHAALSAITAAVVGVILNLSVWFAVHTIFHTAHDAVRPHSCDIANGAASTCRAVAQQARSWPCCARWAWVDTVRQRRARRNMGYRWS
jgi:fumarate reductase subunit D